MSAVVRLLAWAEFKAWICAVVSSATCAVVSAATWLLVSAVRS